MKILAAVMLFMLSTGGAYGIDPETNLAMRLWAPEDIEEYANWIASRRIDVYENDPVTSGILKFQEATGINLGWAPQTREEVVMRRVAYGVLKYWPASRQAVQDHTPGEELTNYHHTVFGKDLLVDYWRNWSAAWHRLWKDSIDTSLDTQKALVSRFEKAWGKWDSQDPPRKIPKGYLPEETDGIWYLVVDSDDDILLQGVMEKRGGFFDMWNNENTRVISYYSVNTHEAAAPFPDMVQFGFAENGKLIMVTDFHYNLRKITKSPGHVNVVWKPNFSWSRGTRLSLESGYPHLNLKKGLKWDYLPLKVSAVKYSDWENALVRVRRLHAMSPEEIGDLMRIWAGIHKMK